MTKLALIATIEVVPGSRDQYLMELLAHRRRSLDGESGTLAFEVLVPHDKPNEIMLYELYADQAAFDAHSTGESMRQIARSTKGMMAGITGVPCTPVE